MKVRALSSSPYVVLGVCWLSFRILTMILRLQKDCSDSPAFVQGFFSASCTTRLSSLKMYVKCLAWIKVESAEEDEFDIKNNSLEYR